MLSAGRFRGRDGRGAPRPRRPSPRRPIVSARSQRASPRGGLALTELLHPGLHVCAQLLETPRSVGTSVHADIARQGPARGFVLRHQAAVDVAVDVPAAVKATVPTAHRVVVEPDVLARDPDHALLDRLAEGRSDRAVVVVALDEVDVAAADAVAVAAGFVELAPAEVAEQPERVVRGHGGVDGVDQGVVVTADGLVGDPPRLAGSLPRPR